MQCALRQLCRSALSTASLTLDEGPQSMICLDAKGDGRQPTIGGLPGRVWLRKGGGPDVHTLRGDGWARPVGDNQIHPVSQRGKLAAGACVSKDIWSVLWVDAQ